MKTHELRIEGMSCQHCVRAVESALRAVPGVSNVEVAIGKARVEADDTVEMRDLVAAVEAEEYTVPSSESV